MSYSVNHLGQERKPLIGLLQMYAKALLTGTFNTLFEVFSFVDCTLPM